MRRAVARIAGVIMGALVFLASSTTRADTPPTRWDRAKDPAIGDRYKLHVLVEQLMLQAGEPRDALHEGSLQKARADLEKASAATSTDIRLRFDLGRVYYELKRYEQALAVLRPALAAAPRDFVSFGAWDALAFSAARLDLSREEIQGYDACIDIALSDDNVINFIGNRAEAYMRLGNLEEAIAGYREVIERVSNDRYGRFAPATIPLALWGLAVALDRNGEPAEAEHEASLATQDDPTERYIGDTDDVFFVPAYERDWYLALGRTQHAKRQTNPEAAAAFWALTVATWKDYITQATAAHDRWLPLARSHLAAAEIESNAASGRWEKMRRNGRLVLPPSPLGTGNWVQ